MPFEVIHHGHPTVIHSVPGDEQHSSYWWEEDVSGDQPDRALDSDREARSRTPKLEVVWSRPEDTPPPPYFEDHEGFVQVGLELDRELLKKYYEMMEEDPNMVSVTLHSEGLNRTRINKMIKTLKRARDAAFGVDE